MSAAVPFFLPVLRAMTHADADAVANLEIASYEFPWSRGIFRDCLRVGYQCRVAIVDDRLAAYGILSTAAGEAHILNLCVASDLRNAGLGRRMLNHLTEIAVRLGSRRLFLEVRPTNTAALALYRGAGFVEIARRKHYYRARGGREDAIVLSLDLPVLHD